MDYIHNGLKSVIPNGLKSVATICIIPTGFARRKRAVGSAHFVGLEFIPID